MSQAQLARACGVKQPSVHGWLSGKSKFLRGENLLRAAEALDVNDQWLATGDGPMGPRHVTTGSKFVTFGTPAAIQAGPPTVTGGSNVEQWPQQAIGKVPLMSYDRVGDWLDATASFDAGSATDWLPCPAPHSNDTFALTVKGDSMESRRGRTYPAGCVIFVDPQKQPADGDRVVARLADSGEITFKVYKHEDGQRWLQPLNDNHLPIRSAFAVIGTVIGKWEAE